MELIFLWNNPLCYGGFCREFQKESIWCNSVPWIYKSWLNCRWIQKKNVPIDLVRRLVLCSLPVTLTTAAAAATTAVTFISTVLFGLLLLFHSLGRLYMDKPTSIFLLQSLEQYCSSVSPACTRAGVISNLLCSNGPIKRSTLADTRSKYQEAGVGQAAAKWPWQL